MQHHEVVQDASVRPSSNSVARRALSTHPLLFARIQHRHTGGYRSSQHIVPRPPFVDPRLQHVPPSRLPHRMLRLGSQRSRCEQHHHRHDSHGYHDQNSGRHRSRSSRVCEDPTRWSDRRRRCCWHECRDARNFDSWDHRGSFSSRHRYFDSCHRWTYSNSRSHPGRRWSVVPLAHHLASGSDPTVRRCCCQRCFDRQQTYHDRRQRTVLATTLRRERQFEQAENGRRVWSTFTRCRFNLDDGFKPSSPWWSTSTFRIYDDQFGSRDQGATTSHGRSDRCGRYDRFVCSCDGSSRSRRLRTLRRTFRAGNFYCRYSCCNDDGRRIDVDDDRRRRSNRSTSDHGVQPCDQLCQQDQESFC